MSLPKYTCKAIGCERPIESWFLMCGEHWHMVPVALRNAIGRQYRISGLSNEYARLVRKAIDAVQDMAPGENLGGIKGGEERLK